LKKGSSGGVKVYGYTIKSEPILSQTRDFGKTDRTAPRPAKAGLANPAKIQFLKFYSAKISKKFFEKTPKW